MSSPRSFKTLSHVLYADILVFCKGTQRSLVALMSLFHSYGEVLGQVLRLGKCRFYAGSISSSRIAAISNVLGFSADQLPFNYLGVPLFKGNQLHTELNVSCKFGKALC